MNFDGIGARADGVWGAHASPRAISGVPPEGLVRRRRTPHARRVRSPAWERRCRFAAAGSVSESERILKAQALPTLEERLLAREKPAGRPVLHMRWEKLLFLHWAWDPGEIQDKLPAGLFVDTFEGKAWLAIVPFFMSRVHPTGLPCVPWLSNFLELNVRTYVHDGEGLPGVWFYSLACNQPLAVELARRCFHLNYVHARMNALIDPRGICSYRTRRRRSPEASFRYGAAGPRAAADPGSLEFFLLERYVLFSAGQNGRLHSGRVHHVPYRFGPALVEHWSFTPAVPDGFGNPARPPDHMMVADDIDVEAWRIRAHPSSS
jgi:uncharacterized protein